jgi:hypothetical protein
MKNIYNCKQKNVYFLGFELKAICEYPSKLAHEANGNLLLHCKFTLSR